MCLSRRPQVNGWPLPGDVPLSTWLRDMGYEAAAAARGPAAARDSVPQPRARDPRQQGTGPMDAHWGPRGSSSSLDAASTATTATAGPAAAAEASSASGAAPAPSAAAATAAAETEAVAVVGPAAAAAPAPAAPGATEGAAAHQGDGAAWPLAGHRSSQVEVRVSLGRAGVRVACTDGLLSGAFFRGCDRSRASCVGLLASAVPPRMGTGDRGLMPPAPPVSPAAVAELHRSGRPRRGPPGAGPPAAAAAAAAAAGGWRRPGQATGQAQGRGLQPGQRRRRRAGPGVFVARL